MDNSFFFNLNNYEFCLKFNFISVFQLPKLASADITFSYKLLKDQPLLASQAIFVSLLLFNQGPRSVLIRKPSAYFKTRKGDPYGFNVKLCGYKVLDFFLHNWLDVIPEALEYGFFDNFNFGLNGQLQFGLRSLKVFPLVKNSPLNHLYYLGGCDQKFSLIPSLNISRSDSGAIKRKALIFFSDFSFFEHV